MSGILYGIVLAGGVIGMVNLAARRRRLTAQENFKEGDITQSNVRHLEHRDITRASTARSNLHVKDLPVAAQQFTGMAPRRMPIVQKTVPRHRLSGLEQSRLWVDRPSIQRRWRNLYLADFYHRGNRHFALDPALITPTNHARTQLPITFGQYA